MTFTSRILEGKRWRWGWLRAGLGLVEGTWRRRVNKKRPRIGPANIQHFYQYYKSVVPRRKHKGAWKI